MAANEGLTPGDRPTDIDGLIDSAFQAVPPTPSPEAFDFLDRGEAMLRAIAQEHRRAQFEHTDEQYKLKEADPERAEVHHGLKYDHMGQAAAIERAQRGIVWGSRPGWILLDELAMLGIDRLEVDLAARDKNEAFNRRFFPSLVNDRPTSFAFPTNWWLHDRVPGVSDIDTRKAA